LDITVPLGGTRHVSAETLRVVLDDLTHGGRAAHFDFDTDGLELRATDLDWSYGSGTTVAGPAEDLALLVTGRTLSVGRVRR
jgi:hypothetical protein